MGLNAHMDVDSHRRGNISRFINSPDDPAQSNCVPESEQKRDCNRVRIVAYPDACAAQSKSFRGITELKSEPVRSRMGSKE